MVIIKSVSVDEDLKEYFDQYKKSGGNISGLLSSLAREYFTGGRSLSDNGSDFSIRHSLIERDIEKIKADLALVEKAMEDMKKDHSSASEKRTSEKEKTEDQILSRLEKEFSDIPIRDGALQYRAWARSLKLDGSDPQGIIKNRIASIATLTGASRADVMGIVKRKYPGMTEILNADPGVL